METLSLNQIDGARIYEETIKRGKIPRIGSISQAVGISNEELMHAVAVTRRERRGIKPFRKKDPDDPCEWCRWKTTGRPCVIPEGLCGRALEGENNGH